MSQVMELSLHRPFGELSAMLSFRDVNVYPGDTPTRKRPTHEERRAVLACYHITSIVATTVKRSDPLRWTASMEEMLRDLERDPEWVGDAMLVLHVKLQQIVEQLSSSRWQPGEFDSTTADPSKGLPAYYLSSLRTRFRDIKAGIPLGFEGYEAMEPMFNSVELMIHESGLDCKGKAPLSASNGHGPSQLDILHSCVDCVQGFFESILSFPPAYYHGFPFAYFSAVAHALLALFRLSVFDDPAWDRTAVRRRVDILKIADRFTENMTMVPELTGLQADGPPGVATAPPPDREAFPNIFIKSGVIMQNMRAGWEADLRNMEGGASQGPGQGHVQGQQDQQQVAMSVPNNPGDVMAVSSGDVSQSITAAPPVAMSSQPQHHPQLHISGSCGLPVMAPQQQPPGLMPMIPPPQHSGAAAVMPGHFDPLSGINYGGGDDGWLADIFVAWDYHNNGVTF